MWMPDPSVVIRESYWDPRRNPSFGSRHCWMQRVNHGTSKHHHWCPMWPSFFNCGTGISYHADTLNSNISHCNIPLQLFRTKKMQRHLLDQIDRILLVASKVTVLKLSMIDESREILIKFNAGIYSLRRRLKELQYKRKIFTSVRSVWSNFCGHVI